MRIAYPPAFAFAVSSTVPILNVIEGQRREEDDEDVVIAGCLSAIAAAAATAAAAAAVAAETATTMRGPANILQTIINR